MAEGEEDLSQAVWYFSEASQSQSKEEAGILSVVSGPLNR